MYKIITVLETGDRKFKSSDAYISALNHLFQTLSGETQSKQKRLNRCTNDFISERFQTYVQVLL